MSKVSIPSGTLEYVESGQGVPLILLHGGTGSIHEWDTCIDHFATRYRVIAYNRRGYGESTPRYSFSQGFLQEDAEDLLAFLDGLGLTIPVLLCAFSDGGTIALIFAGSYPERIRAIVCAGAHIYADEQATEALLRTRRIFKNRVQGNGIKKTPQIRSQMAWFDRWLHPDFKSFSIEAAIPRIKCPTLIVQGTEDEYASVGHAQRIASGIKDAQLWLIQGAQHWVHGGQHNDSFKAGVMAFLADK